MIRLKLFFVEVFMLIWEPHDILSMCHRNDIHIFFYGLFCRETKIFNISCQYILPFVLALLHVIQFPDYLKYQWYVYISNQLDR